MFCSLASPHAPLRVVASLSSRAPHSSQLCNLHSRVLQLISLRTSGLGSQEDLLGARNAFLQKRSLIWEDEALLTAFKSAFDGGEHASKFFGSFISQAPKFINLFFSSSCSAQFRAACGSGCSCRSRQSRLLQELLRQVLHIHRLQCPTLHCKHGASASASRLGAAPCGGVEVASFCICRIQKTQNEVFLSRWL